MTTPEASSRRAPGPAILTAAIVAAVIAVLPVVETLATLVGTAGFGDPRYVGQILAVRSPFLILVPLVVGVVTAVGFAGVAPIGSALRMAQVVRRGFATAVVGFVLAALAAVAASVVSTLAGLGAHALSQSVGQMLFFFWRVVVSDGAGQLAAQTNVLLAVPLGALLLWGWLRREPPQAVGTPIGPEV